MATQTPWGKSDSKKIITRGIVFYGTPSHGGYHVSKKLLQTMPKAFVDHNDLTRHGWFEEDCLWSFVALSFPLFFEKDLQLAHSTCKNWYPLEYEKAFNVKVSLEESLTLRENDFRNRTTNQYVVKTAFGDWKQGVPKGMVALLTQRESDHSIKWIIVQDSEYQQLGGHFVVEDRHTEIAPLS